MKQKAYLIITTELDEEACENDSAARFLREQEGGYAHSTYAELPLGIRSWASGLDEKFESGEFDEEKLYEDIEELSREVHQDFQLLIERGYIRLPLGWQKKAEGISLVGIGGDELDWLHKRIVELEDQLKAEREKEVEELAKLEAEIADLEGQLEERGTYSDR